MKRTSLNAVFFSIALVLLAGIGNAKVTNRGFGYKNGVDSTLMQKDSAKFAHQRAARIRRDSVANVTRSNTQSAGRSAAVGGPRPGRRLSPAQYQALVAAAKKDSIAKAAAGTKAAAIRPVTTVTTTAQAPAGGQVKMLHAQHVGGLPAQPAAPGTGATTLVTPHP